MKISQTVFELQSGHDFVTDGRTDQGKKKKNVSQPDVPKYSKVE